MGRMFIGFVIGILLAPVLGAVVAFSGHFPVEATTKPPGWERRLAGMALDPAVDRKAKGLVDPTSATDADLMKGMKIYREHCASCHGDRDKPSAWGRDNFYPHAPQLYRRGVHDPVPNIFVVVKYGVRYTGMGGWKDQMPDDDLWRVSGFLHRIRTLPASVDSAWSAAARADSDSTAGADAR